MFTDLPCTDKQLEIRINGQERPTALEFMLTTSLLFIFVFCCHGCVLFLPYLEKSLSWKLYLLMWKLLLPVQYLPDSNSEIIPAVLYWAYERNFSFPCKLYTTLLMCYIGESGEFRARRNFKHSLQYSHPTGKWRHGKVRWLDTTHRLSY